MSQGRISVLSFPPLGQKYVRVVIMLINEKIKLVPNVFDS